MNPDLPYRTRRATVDDLPQLKAMWQDTRLPVETLEKKFTDFQVVTDASGAVIAAIAIRVAGSQGYIHSEVFADFGQTDLLRPILWEHLQGLAKNLGLFRLWTKEQPPFWRKDAGFSEADRELLAKLPAAFGMTEPGWFSLRLRDEAADPELLERQFEMFRLAEQEKREQMLSQARALKWLGTLIAVGCFLGAFILLFYVLHRGRR